jgi:dihydrofolate reductase
MRFAPFWFQPLRKENRMGQVIAGMTMSLDGFVNDRSGSAEPLYPDFATLRNAPPLQESIQQTGAVVMGRNAFAMAHDPDWYAGNYEYQVPIFVVTHQKPLQHPKETNRLTFTFVTNGLASAIEQAKAAAGEKDVTVIGGASIIQQGLIAGLVDELDVDIMPVLLGGGLRLFENLGNNLFQLERISVMALPSGRTHLRYRVVR